MRLSELILLPFSILSDLTRILFLEGDWFLRPHEKRLLELAGQDLSETNRAILSNQLTAFKWIAREQKGRITFFYFKLPSLVPRMDLPKDYGMARMTVSSVDGRTWLSVAARNGLIDFIQYQEVPKPIFDHPFTLEKIEFGGEPDERIAKEIHNDEHGGTDSEWK